MRGKRSKQYRKLMQQYTLHFGFREPYQVLLDGAILEDAARFKMDFVTNLGKALHGQIKPMLTTCTIRHLSTRNDQHSEVMTHARALERRRCNHHELEAPLSEFDCLSSVVDPKGTKNNKHKLVVASQDDKIRNYMRSVPGTPMVYLKRSVLVMEPMADSTVKVREDEERGKMRAGIKGSRGSVGSLAGQGVKRKRSDEEVAGRGSSNIVGGVSGDSDEAAETAPKSEKKKRRKGPSGPNPLSAKKAKTKTATSQSGDIESKAGSRTSKGAKLNTDAEVADPEPKTKRKRKRRHKTGGAETSTPDGATTAASATDS